MAELVHAYLLEARIDYGDGVDSEYRNVAAAARLLVEYYGPTRAALFGPRKLKVVRAALIERGCARTYCNAQTHRIRRIFRWAVAEELLTPSILQALQAVRGLRRGRHGAREPAPVRPVPIGDVEAIKQYVSRQVWAAVQLQLHTAARPGEILGLRPIDLDMSGRVWVARLADHKTAWRGRQRTIYLGPRSQEAVRPFLGRPVRAYLFSPAEAVRELHQRRGRQRRTPASCGNRPGTNRRPSSAWKPGQRYTRRSYATAIYRGCDLAGVPRWCPNRLRHTAATQVRRAYGLEAAQVWLGHARADVTQIYAEVNDRRACELAQRIG